MADLSAASTMTPAILIDLNPLPVANATPDSIEPAPSLAEPLAWRERRDQLRAWIQQRILPGISPHEIDQHFSAMPNHYWQRTNEGELLWGLETIHGFLKLLASPEVPPTAPFVSWRQIDSRCARVMLCTWDRHGLLAKAAAAFAAVHLNILQAEVFTRADNLVLDQFVVTDADARGPVCPARLEEMAFLLDGALSEPPRFASIWACSRHKFLAPRTLVSPRITWDNTSSPGTTAIRIEATDRLGLLYDLLQAIADHGLDIKQATIATENGLARDVIHLSDEQGQKVVDPDRLESLRQRLETALTIGD